MAIRFYFSMCIDFPISLHSNDEDHNLNWTEISIPLMSIEESSNVADNMAASRMDEHRQLICHIGVTVLMGMVDNMRGTIDRLKDN